MKEIQKSTKLFSFIFFSKLMDGRPLTFSCLSEAMKFANSFADKPFRKVATTLIFWPRSLASLSRICDTVRSLKKQNIQMNFHKYLILQKKSLNCLDFDSRNRTYSYRRSNCFDFWYFVNFGPPSPPTSAYF